MVELTPQRFAELLDRFSAVSVAVVGDYFIDKYLVIDPRLSVPSVETGLEAYQVTARRMSPGAAGTVVGNLHALGVGAIHAIGVTGCDGEGFELRRALQQWGVHTDGLLEEPDIFTPTYTKPMLLQPDGSERETSRLDILNRRPLNDRLQAELAEQIRDCAGRLDAIIIADQVEEAELGTITPPIRQAICELGRQRPDMPLLVDSRANIGEFTGVIVKPNLSEAARALGMERSSSPSVELAQQIAHRLAERTGRTVYLTMGTDGMAVWTPDPDQPAASRFTHLPAYPVEGPVDIVGAGDSATAGIVPALCAGATAAGAGLFGILAASITIQQIGTTGTASPADMRRRFDQYMQHYPQLFAHD